MLLKFILLSALLMILVPTHAFAQEELIILETTSDQDTFTVEISWTSSDIGSENTFEIRFVEPETSKEVEDVVYDFGVMQDGEMLFMRADQDSGLQTVTFDELGSYTILIYNIDGLGEDASISIQVTPEFHLAWTLPAAFVALFVLHKRLSR